MERQTAAVLQERDHRRGGLVVFRLADPCWWLGREHRATESAAQPFQFIDLRRQGRHPGHANQQRRLSSLHVQATRTTRLGAAIAVLQAGMGDRDAWRAGIVLGPVATVPGALLLLASRVRIGRACRCTTGVRFAGCCRGTRLGVGRWTLARLLFPDNRGRALARRAEDDPLHPRQRSLRRLEFGGHPREGVHRRPEGGLLRLGQRTVAGALDNGVELLNRNLYPPGWFLPAPAHAKAPRRRRKSACSG